MEKTDTTSEDQVSTEAETAEPTYRYSSGLKEAQKAERRVSKATSRIARAVAKGVERFEEKRDKSAGKRKDGAIIDFIPNVSEGFAKAIRESSWAPVDLTKGITSKRVRKALRRQTRLLEKPLRFFVR